METFEKLFARFLVFVYHCFDRIVIQGRLPLLTRPEHTSSISSATYTANIPSLHKSWPNAPWNTGGGGRLRPQSQEFPSLRGKGVSQEEAVRPYRQSIERRNQHGVYGIFTSMEMGSTFTSKMPKFPTQHPNYRIIRRLPSPYLHSYFYIRDPVVRPLALCVGAYHCASRSTTAAHQEAAG
jgi:hypothetical protein